jgi:ornithine lipid hydroxylase
LIAASSEFEARGAAYRIASRIVFPALLAGAATGIGVGMQLGHPIAAVAPVVYFSTAMAVAVLERLMPFEAAWNRQHDLLGDAAAAITIATVVDGVYRGLVIGALSVAGGWLSTRAGDVWPSTSSLWVQYPLLVAEFGTYWAHRLSHRTSFLWRFHSVHHAVPQLYWLNNGRFHPLDFAFTNVTAQVVLLASLGAPESTITLVSTTASILGLLAHSNIDLDCRWLTWVFNSPHLHRWHHSTIERESSANFCFNLVFFDILFGTRFLPADRRPPRDLGNSIPNFPRSYLRQLWEPLRRQRG